MRRAILLAALLLPLLALAESDPLAAIEQRQQALFERIAPSVVFISRGNSIGSGFFVSAELTPNIAGAVRNLKPGEVSEVVPSDVGFHVFKLLSREGGGEWTYEEVKDRVVGVMVEERAQAMTDNWLQSVRSKYFIRRTDGRTGAPTGSPETGAVAPPESVASPTAGTPAQ